MRSRSWSRPPSGTTCAKPIGGRSRAYPERRVAPSVLGGQPHQRPHPWLRRADQAARPGGGRRGRGGGPGRRRGRPPPHPPPPARAAPPPPPPAPPPRRRAGPPPPPPRPAGKALSHEDLSQLIIERELG